MVFPHTTCDLVKTTPSSPLDSVYSTAKKKKGTTCLASYIIICIVFFLISGISKYGTESICFSSSIVHLLCNKHEKRLILVAVMIPYLTPTRVFLRKHALKQNEL